VIWPGPVSGGETGAGADQSVAAVLEFAEVVARPTVEESAPAWLAVNATTIVATMKVARARRPTWLPRSILQ